MADALLTSRTLRTHRVVVELPEPNREFDRVELVIDGYEFVMSRPDAQRLAHFLMQAQGLAIDNTTGDQ